MPEPWTYADDERLVAWGGGMQDGYAFVAAHDLGRTEAEGRERIAWLRENKPLFVAHVERYGYEPAPTASPPAPAP